jgi:hypothetical protein
MEVILMPRKRKTKAKQPTITVKAAPPPVAPTITQKRIRCIWDSKLIVGSNKTPTGTRYEFETDQIKPVNEDDYQYLLDMRAKAPGCCGGHGGSSIINSQKYFEAVEV